MSLGAACSTSHSIKLKTLDEFQFSATPHIAASKLKELTDGGYIERVRIPAM